MKKLIIGATLAAASLAAQAQDSNWRFYLGLGASSGGETVVSGIKTVDGTSQVIDYSIAAGNGLQKRVGFDYRLGERFTLQASIGHYVSEVTGYNGSIDFTIVPVEFMAFADIAAGVRVGAGLRQSSAEMRTTGIAANAPFAGTFKSNGGTVVELQYLFANGERKKGAQFGISLRRVNEKFNHALGELNGDHSEVAMTVYY